MQVLACTHLRGFANKGKVDYVCLGVSDLYTKIVYITLVNIPDLTKYSPRLETYLLNTHRRSEYVNWIMTWLALPQILACEGREIKATGFNEV